MAYTMTKNEQFGSIEILFDGKPSDAIRDVLKALKFRWHGVRRIWYGYTDEQTARAAIDSAPCSEVRTDGQNRATERKQNRPSVKKSALVSLWDRCDVSALAGYGTDNEVKRVVREEARAAGGSYDKHVAAYIRKHLRERFPECKFSVTSGGAGWLNNVDICLKSSPYSRELVKGDPSACCSRDCWDHWENSAELDAVLNYCKVLFDSFDDDDGDHYADYGAHHDLYGGVSIKSDYVQTEPTAEQRASAEDFAQRKADAEAAEEARRAAELEEWRRQQEIEQIENERREMVRKEWKAEIMQHVVIDELAQDEQIAVIGLLEPCGKETTLGEVRESILERSAKGREPRVDAVITRKVNFTNATTFEHFCTMLLDDFEFLAGMGGSATEDVRVTSENFDKLNAEQRKTVKCYLCNCVGVYLNDTFQFVVDPQGYSHARYVLIPDEATDSYRAIDKLSEWREQSEQLTAMYFPKPLAEQMVNAGMQSGERFTMIHLDPWTVTAITTAATLNSATVTKYAQYDEAIRIEYTPQGKCRPEQNYIIPGQACAIWRGILPDIPDSIKYTELCAGMQRVNYAGDSARGYMIQVIDYFKTIGFVPVIDTIQR